ncbi:MAG: hypothetical protein Ct9H90mP13_11780 [Pseudomonadota bacterium]|nr:MAG: hypothetical protein Ct9H90mP13_11780 [Pseudomonadota bacterium]
MGQLSSCRGVSRVDLLDIRSDEYFKADYCPLDEFGDESDKDIQGLKRTMISQVESYVRITKKIPAEGVIPCKIKKAEDW